MLHKFLEENKKEILTLTKEKSLKLAGFRPSSLQLEKGLPIFFGQLIHILKLEQQQTEPPVKDIPAMSKAAGDNDEPGLAKASGSVTEAGLAQSAGEHGSELMRLGYTLSHAVHAYGSMCQSITELASRKRVHITPLEFRDLNRCLDVAIAGAVTQFQMKSDTKEKEREIQHLGFLAHELRNALMSVTVSFAMIKKGSIGAQGNTGNILEEGLRRMKGLIDRSLVEVRLRVDPKIHPERVNLLELVNQINTTAEVDAEKRNLTLETLIDPDLSIEVDHQLLYSALSNLIQNAIKFTHENGLITIRGRPQGERVIIEVEDECGGLKDATVDLFKPYEQQHQNAQGLGLGLSISQKAISLNRGSIEVKDLPGKGCIFTITLPLRSELASQS